MVKLFAASLLTILISVDLASARPSPDEIVSALMQLCLGESSYEKLEASGKGEVAFALRNLLNGGAQADVAGMYTREEWSGLNGGISAQLTEVQADQADKVRECIAPFRAKIIDAMLAAP